jgi:hypothetical protein
MLATWLWWSTVVGCVDYDTLYDSLLPEPAHEGDEPAFPLEGAHAMVSCGDCHGEEPKALPAACVDCHEDDRPSADHYPEQGCADCHDAYGWTVAAG